jgi:phosphoglycolate phosphatase-like HAD superfamily hydrolase
LLIQPSTTLFNSNYQAMSLRYPCLILDHDDTAVDSTSEIHYPAHVEVMRRLRPGTTPVSLENWFRKNFDPGIMDFLKKELEFNEDEIDVEFQVWREFTARLIPDFYPGFLDLIIEYRKQGGLVTVVSHSEVDIIKQHYTSATNGNLFLPDLIHGWTVEAEKRKPNPFPINQILQQYSLSKEQVLVVDDLKPGVEMAKAAGVPIAAAGWSHQIEEIKDYMQQNCDLYFNTIDDFARAIFN